MTGTYFSHLVFVILCVIILMLLIAILAFGAWLSLVERYVRDVEAARSNRVAPTNKTEDLRERRSFLHKQEEL